MRNSQKLFTVYHPSGRRKRGIAKSTLLGRLAVLFFAYAFLIDFSNSACLAGGCCASVNFFYFAFGSFDPVILLEGLLLKVWLKTSTVRALKASALANVASAVAGVPLATLLAYLGAMLVSPWTRQMVQKEHWQSPIGDVLMAIANSIYISAYVVEARWLLPAALLIILVPAYLISWWIEYLIINKMISKWADATPSEEESLNTLLINRAVRRANFVSYVLLYVFIAFRLIRSQFS